MLVKLNYSPGEPADRYLSVDTITEVKVYNDTNTISYTTTACDTYSEHFSSRDALDARFEEVQSWFAPNSTEYTVDTPTPTAAANNPMRNCNGYNSPMCEHNCKADDCSGCPFESTTKHLVDLFMQLPDALKAQFIDEALSHQCITEDEFSMLMSSLPEEDSSTTVEEPDEEIDEELDELAPTDAPSTLYAINVTIYGATATENPSASITVDNGKFTHERHEPDDTSQASIMNLKSVVAHRLLKAIGEIYNIEWNDKNK